MTDLQQRYAQAQQHQQGVIPANQPKAVTSIPPTVRITRFRKDCVEIVERVENKERRISKIKVHGKSAHLSGGVRRAS